MGDPPAPSLFPERGLVRQRLLRVLDRADLVIVVSPAGSGKTTLLQQFADHSHARVTWCRSMPDAAGPEFFVRASSALDDGASVDDPAGPGPVLIVDDFQAIVASSAEAEFERLIVGRRRRAKVLIASRQRPTMNVSRAECGTVTVVTADDLRFRSWEAEDLFRHVYRDPLPPQSAAALTRHTEGWAAGLHMFHLSTKGYTSRDRHTAIEALSGRSRVLQSYLARTVVGELPGELRRFLRLSCVLETLTGDLCDRLLGGTESHGMLVELERLQALTTSEDDGRTFRYHEILRAHLVAALHEELGAAGVAEWYGTAAALVEADGSVAQAIRLYARAERWSDVARLLRRDGARLASASDESPGWSEWLPRRIIDQDPWLSVAAARRQVAGGRLRKGADRYRHAEQLFTDPAARDHAARERRQVETWLDRSAQPATHWIDRLRGAVRRNPLAAAASPMDTAGDALGQAVARLLAGHIVEARRVLLWSDHARGATGWVALSLRFCETVLGGLTGEDVAEAIDRLAGDAERAGVTFLSRQCRALAATLALDGVGTRRVREECDAAGDEWGGVLASAFDAVRMLLAGEPATAAWADTAARCHAAGSDTAQAWAVAFGALAASVERRPDAADESRRAEAFARAAGVPGARVIALLALGSAVQARAVAAEIGLPWPNALVRLLPPARSHATEVTGHDRRVVLHVRCFAAFDIGVGDRVLDWRALRPRAATTLRLLSVRAGRPVHREFLLDALWPDLSVAQARQNLQVTISTLRKLLEPDSARGCAEILVREGDTYRLVLHPGASADVAGFDDAIDEARRAYGAHNPRGRRDALARAVHTYRGDLLPEDGAAEWVVAERERLRSRAAIAAASLAELDLTAGDVDAALTAAHRSLEIDPYLDQSWRLLITAYEQADDRAAAERCRREYRDVLADLGLAEAPSVPRVSGGGLRATA